jgi:hypothetical protein
MEGAYATGHQTRNQGHHRLARAWTLAPRTDATALPSMCRTSGGLRLDGLA